MALSTFHYDIHYRNIWFHFQPIRPVNNVLKQKKRKEVQKLFACTAHDSRVNIVYAHRTSLAWPANMDNGHVQQMSRNAAPPRKIQNRNCRRPTIYDAAMFISSACNEQTVNEKSLLCRCCCCCCWCVAEWRTRPKTNSKMCIMRCYGWCSKSRNTSITQAALRVGYNLSNLVDDIGTLSRV